jgi:hypothetical protein
MLRGLAASQDTSLLKCVLHLLPGPCRPADPACGPTYMRADMLLGPSLRAVPSRAGLVDAAVRAVHVYVS